MLLQAVGAARDPNSGGRQMPSHWSSPRCTSLPARPRPVPSSCTAPVARMRRLPDSRADEVTLVCSGEGATSEGEFWESINSACLDRLPLVFLVEDNGYAISVRWSGRQPGGNIANLRRVSRSAAPRSGRDGFSRVVR